MVSVFLPGCSPWRPPRLPSCSIRDPWQPPFRLSRPTIGDYFALSERSYLLERVPPWHSDPGRRLLKTPKFHVVDTGLACTLLGVSASSLLSDRPLPGHLIETFDLQELRRQASWHDDLVYLFHFRDRYRYKVDIVMELGDPVSGVEVKLGATVTSSDFQWLNRLKNASGKRLAAGVVRYDGETRVSFGEGMHAIPVRLPWEG